MTRLLYSESGVQPPHSKPLRVPTLKPAPDFDDLGGGLAHWQQYDPASKVDLHAHAVRGAGGGLFFIDPIPLHADALELLTSADATPAGVIVTNANHARAADAFRRRWQVPLWMHADAAAETGLVADHTIPGDGRPICGDGALEAIPLPGAAAGEIALYRAGADGGVMIVGDALVHLPSHGFTVLPDKYCADAKTLRRSLAALLDREFETLLFAHGEPIMRGARARLAGLLGA